MAGATAFFANFAIPPILLILIRLFSFFVDRKILTQRIFERISEVLVPSSALQIRETLRNIRKMEHQWWATILSFIFLLFVATTLFNVIKNAVEQIWNIGQDKKNSVLFSLKSRSRSMAIIILAGILFFLGLFSDGIQSNSQGYFNLVDTQTGETILWIINQLLFTAIVSFWFAVLFRFLANGRPKWNIALKGGILTGILFNLGKHILRIMLPLSNIEHIYGASGSIVLLMLFIFYSSLIFYFGACFVKILSDNKQHNLRTVKGAFRYEIKVLD